MKDCPLCSQTLLYHCPDQPHRCHWRRCRTCHVVIDTVNWRAYRTNSHDPVELPQQKPPGSEGAR